MRYRMKSKYPSKSPCLTCGATWKVGDEITKINDKYWCSNPTCGGGAQTAAPTTSSKPKIPGTHGMILHPGDIEKDEDKVDIAAFNTYVRNVRHTCYQLALDLNPTGDDFSLRVGTAGLIHDAIEHQAQSRNTRAVLDQTVVLSEILSELRKLQHKP